MIPIEYVYYAALVAVGALIGLAAAWRSPAERRVEAQLAAAVAKDDLNRALALAACLLQGQDLLVSTTLPSHWSRPPAIIPA